MDKSHVSMEQKQCLVCGTVFDTGAILLDKRLRQHLEKTTITGLGLCADCQQKNDDGFIALVEAQPPSRGDTIRPSEAVRTGMIAHLRRSVFGTVFKSPAPNDKHGHPLPMIFVEPGVIERLRQMVRS